MNKTILMTFVLGAGMAFAQAGSANTSDQSGQQPATPGAGGQTQTAPDNNQNIQNQTNPNDSHTNPVSTPNAGNQTGADRATTLSGCLRQSEGNWVLSRNGGQDVTVTGDASMLKPHDGHQVEIQGIRSGDSANSPLQANSVTMISDACGGQASSGSGMNGSSTNQNSAAAGAGSNAIENSPGRSTTAGAASNTTTPVTSDTSATTVGSGGKTGDQNSASTPAQDSESMHGSGAPQAGASDQSAPSNSGSPGNPGVPGSPEQTGSAAARGSGAADQNSQNQLAQNQNSSGLSNDLGSNDSRNSGSRSRLPQTASPLPFLGLIGAGSLVSSWLLRKSK